MKPTIETGIRLCIVTPCVKMGDGQGRVNYEIINEAIQRGYQVTILAHDVASELIETGQVTWIRFSNLRLPTAILKELFFAKRTQAWLKKNASQYDLIKVCGTVSFFPGDINAVHFVHHAWLNSSAHISKHQRNLYGFYQWINSSLQTHWERQVLQKAKIVVAISEQIKSDLMKRGISQDKIRVVLNGVDSDEFSPPSQDVEQYRSQLDLPSDVPIAVFAGDIRTGRKNLDSVLKALVEVPSLHLAVVGNPEGSPFPFLAKELNISDRIHFMGYRKDLPDIMRACDLFVFPSRYEPFGMVVTEAMATGLPVVTATSTGASSLVTLESGIVISDPDNILELSKALQRLVNDPELMKAMGRVGRSIVIAYTWSRMAHQYLDLFETQLRSCDRQERSGKSFEAMTI
jgi:glycosyltransferase involved in cell wall biosynthesis